MQFLCAPRSARATSAGEPAGKLSCSPAFTNPRQAWRRRLFLLAQQVDPSPASGCCNARCFGEADLSHPPDTLRRWRGSRFESPQCSAHAAVLWSSPLIGGSAPLGWSSPLPWCSGVLRRFRRGQRLQCARGARSSRASCARCSRRRASSGDVERRSTRRRRPRSWCRSVDRSRLAASWAALAVPARGSSRRRISMRCIPTSVARPPASTTYLETVDLARRARRNDLAIGLSHRPLQVCPI